MSPKWRHRSLLTLLSITGRTNNYSWIEHHWENTKAWEWDWGTLPAPQRLRQTALQEWKEWLHTDSFAFDPAWASTESCKKVSPEPIVPLMGTVRRWHPTPSSTLWVTLWEPLLCFHSFQGWQGNLYAQPLGIWLKLRRGKDFQ